MAQAEDADEWRRFGWLLLPCLGGVLLTTSYSYSLGVMIGPLEHEFGWSRASISAGPLFISVVGLAVAPLVGIGVDRFGPRPIGLAGVAAVSAALALLGTATSNILSWWALWGLIAFAAMLIGPAVWTSAINRGFARNRGKALAIALCGTGVGATIVPPLTNALVTAYGWRGAYAGLGLISFVAVFPAVFFLFREPHHVAAASARHAAHPPQDIRAQLASPRFLKLAGAITLFSFAGVSLSLNAVPILLSKGFDRPTAAGLAGLIGLGAIAGRLIGGVMLDHWDAKKVAAAGSVLLIAPVLLLVLAPDSRPAAILACAMIGLSAGAEVDTMSYLTARHFGMGNFGGLFGVLTALTYVAAGVAPAASNMVYDLQRSYDPVLWTIIPLSLAAAALYLRLGAYPPTTGEAGTPIA